jgi:hypothetical protein
MADIAPLVECIDGTYTVNRDTLDFLAKREKPFAVVVVTGKFRTGKSYMLNRLLSNTPGKGFGVGDTVNSCTKGLLISKKVLSVSDKLDIIFMDAEGIDSLDASSTHDTRIVTLAILLSSMFMYNSVGVLDEAAISTLSFMTKVADTIKENVMPPLFIWVLRDFGLQLVDRSGNDMHRNDYLEESLAHDDPTRQAIRSLFQERYLFTLPRPSKTETTQKLDTKPGNVNPKFSQLLGEMRDFIIDRVQPMEMNGKSMSGKVYAEMVTHLVDVVQTSAVPVLEDTWSLLIKMQRKELMHRLVLTAVSDVATWTRADVEKNQKDLVALLDSSVELLQKECPATSEEICEFREEITNAVSQTIADKTIDIRQIIEDVLQDMGTEFSTTCDPTVLRGAIEAFRPTCDPKYYHDYFLPSLVAHLVDDWIPATTDAAIQRKSDECEQTITFLKSELQKERDTLDMLTSEYINKTTTNECVTTSFSSATQTEPMEPRVNHDSDEIVALRSHLVDVEEEKSMLQKELDSFRDEYTCAHETFHTQLRELKEKYKLEKESTVSKYEKDIENIQSHLDEERQARSQDDVKMKSLHERLKHTENDLRDANDRIVDIHKTTLEEMRNRDSAARDKTTEWMKEQLGLQAKLSDERRTSACATTEVCYLKRQMDDYEELQSECKRLRKDIEQSTTTRTRQEVELEHLKVTARNATSEKYAIQRTNIQLETKLALCQSNTM